MILDNIKRLVESKVGNKCQFVYHGSRNQKDEFCGVITKVFPAIFLVLCDDGYIKSYSYNDVLISTLEIIS